MNERRPARGFDAVETWVFDLDNTLYPHYLNLWQQVDARIRDYIVGFLNVTHDEALRVQKDYYRRYGTTMRGLMEEHGLDPDKFLAVVHEIDHSPLTPDPALGAAIASLSGRKLILTNGTRRHAEAVMRRLEIEQHFDDVFDIAAADLEPKPRPQVYDRFLKRHGVDPAKAAIFEPRSTARARHDHGAGGALGHSRSLPRGMGACRPRRASRRPCHRRSCRLPAGHRGAARWRLLEASA